MLHQWSHPIEVTNEPGWQGEASALVAWAMWTVDALYYLADLDASVRLPSPPDAHQWHVIDLAHARWSAASAVSAIDLCAAALARRAGIGPVLRKDGTEREYNLRELNESAEAGEIAGALAAWAQTVWANEDVQLLLAIRHPTTHARLRRHFARNMGSDGGDGDRTRLVVGDVSDEPIAVSTIVTLARNTASAIVEDFLDQIATGRF